MKKYLYHWNLYLQTLANRRGSPTVEYVILIGVGAAVAGLLAAALSGDHNSGIVTTIAKKISAIINQATTPTTGDGTSNTKSILAP